MRGAGEPGFRVAHVLPWSARVQGAGEAGFRAGGPRTVIGCQGAGSAVEAGFRVYDTQAQGE